MEPRDWAKLCVFYTQELMLDSATPGAEAKDRLTRNAKLLKDGCEAWISYCGWKPAELMKEIYRDNPEAYKRQEQGKVRKPR